MMIGDLIRSLHDRWANLHPILRFLLGLVVLAALGLVAVKPAYKLFREWRMDRNLTAARSAVDEQRMQEARDLSLTVLRAGNPSIEAFRILEKSTEQLRDPRHGEIARALISHPEGTDADRLTGFVGIVMQVPLGLVGQAWNALPEDCQKDPRFATAFAQRLIAAKRIGEAASVLLEVPEDKRDAAVKRALIRALIGSGKSEGFDEAQRMIAAGFPDDAAEQSEWLDLLEEIPVLGLRKSLLAPIRERLENPESGNPARSALILARIDYADQWARRAAVLGETIARWKDRDPEALARFLNDLGLYGMLLESIPEDRIEAHPALLPLMMSAAERVGDWEQVRRLLDAHGQRLPKIEELAQRLVLAVRTEDATRQAESREAAMAEAKADSSNRAFLTLHRIFRDAELEEEADRAMVGAIRMGRGPLPLYQDLKSLLMSLERQENEQALLEICAIYLSFEPGNPVLLTQYAYLACMNDVVEPQAIVQAMEPLAKAFPKELPIQSVLASAYLFDDQPAKAAEILDPLKLDPATLAPAHRAVFLLTQLLNARMTKDDPQIARFPWKSLLASERRKFSELIRRAE
jgi:hypothetical protein